MLTSDLVRFRRRGGAAEPRWLGPEGRARLEPVAREIVEVYRAHVGRSRADLDEALAAISVPVRDRVVAMGLRKLCDDRTTLERPAGAQPEAVRRVVFSHAARAHRAAHTAAFDRDAVLAAASGELEASVDDVERALFADLRDAQIVAAFERTTAGELLARYDVALAQAALLRSSRVEIDFEDPDPARVRGLFRAARFHGLLHAIERRDRGWRMVVDGPFSLFDAVQKYGVRLAMFLPAVLALRRFELRADVLVGAGRTPARMVLSDALGLPPLREPPVGLRPEVERLAEAFTALGSEWDVGACDAILAAGGQAVIVPDLAFVSRETGEEVFFEMMGFWSRDAVWRRIEQIREGVGARILLGVSAKLRVSREALDEGTGSALVVFKTAPSAKEVLARLRAPAEPRGSVEE